MTDVRKMSDDMLIAILDKRVALETQNESEMIDFIREVMYRRLYLKYGGTSIFDFMTCAHYHYAGAVAQRKIDAARLMHLFPEVKDYLRDGDVNLSQLGMMGTAFRQKPTPPKLQGEILEAIKGQTIRNTQVILNEMLEIEVKERPKVRVQRDGSVRVEVTFSKEEWEEIENAKDVVSHSVPDGDLAKVLAYCALPHRRRMLPNMLLLNSNRQDRAFQTKNLRPLQIAIPAATPAVPTALAKPANSLPLRKLRRVKARE